MSDRSETVTIRLTPEEHRKAAAVATHRGLNIAAWFRMRVTEEAREIGADTPKATKR